jgi:putative sterol carrier protein
MKTKRMRSCLTIGVMLGALSLSAFGATSSEPDNKTPQDVFDGMRKSFRAEKAKGVHARYQWELSGPNGGQWWIDVNDGTFEMGRGKIDNPSVTFVTSDKDWVALSNGTLGGKWAFFTGRLKIRGPQSLARKLDEIFP